MSREPFEVSPWESLSRSLAVTIRSLRDGDSFTICREEPDAECDELGDRELPRYLQVCRQADSVRFEVVSSTYLPPEHRWTSDQETALLAMGWNHPSEAPSGGPNWFVDVDDAWLEVGTDMVVRVLRDLWDAQVLQDVVMDSDALRRFRWIEESTQYS